MDLDLALNASRRLSPLVLPELTRLTAAKKRVLDRWPDIVPDPPERDQEAIIAQMLALLQSNRWDDVKMSFVLRALKVAFNPNFRTREDVAPVIDFAFEELEATTQSTFLNAMVAIYLSSYEPKADHSLDLGAKITAKRNLLSGKWRAIEETYPGLFDASRTHEDIAASMEDMDEPWQGLKAKGFPNPHAVGLMDHVHAAYVEKIRPNLHMESWLDVLFKWLNPEPGKRKTSGSIHVIEAVLGHWVRKSPSDQTRQAITEHLINQYNDPRTNRSLWVGVSEDYMNVIFSWLTREDLRFFTSVVDATQRDPQWQPRKKFWLKLYDEGLIEQAWVAFCPSAERYARTHLIRSGYADNVRRFAKQSKGGTRSDTSILIMKIGGKIVVDGCHNYRSHIFNIDDPVAPKLFRREYDCDADVMDVAPWSKAHNSIPAWSQWVRESIHSKTPMSTKKPWRRSPARDDDPDRQPAPIPQHAAGYTPAAPVRTPYTPPTTRPVHNPPAQPVRPAAATTPAPTQTPFQTRAGTPTVTPTVTPTKAQAATTRENLAQNRFAGSVLNTEIEDLSSRLRGSGGNNQAMQVILRKVAERHTLNSEERKIFSQCIARYRRKWDDLRTLSDYLTPIFDRVMTLSERSKWALQAEQLRTLADQYGLSSPNSTTAINKIAKGDMLTKSETNAMEHLAQRLRAQGIEVLDLIRKE
ncbi:MAG: EH signature domain-containing protein [Paracoccaceae bacterium]